LHPLHLRVLLQIFSSFPPSFSKLLRRKEPQGDKMASKLNPLDMVGTVAMSVATNVAAGVVAGVATGAKTMAAGVGTMVSGEAHFFDESITVSETKASVPES
jgi:hypothetical protein